VFFRESEAKPRSFSFLFIEPKKRPVAADEQQGKQIIGGFRTLSAVSAPFRKVLQKQSLPLPETNKE